MGSIPIGAANTRLEGRQVTVILPTTSDNPTARLQRFRPGAEASASPSFPWPPLALSLPSHVPAGPKKPRLSLVMVLYGPGFNSRIRLHPLPSTPYMQVSSSQQDAQQPLGDGGAIPSSLLHGTFFPYCTTLPSSGRSARVIFPDTSARPLPPSRGLFMLRYPNLVEERVSEARQCQFKSDSEYQPGDRRDPNTVGVALRTSCPDRRFLRLGRRTRVLGSLSSILTTHPKHRRAQHLRHPGWTATVLINTVASRAGL